MQDTSKPDWLFSWASRSSSSTSTKDGNSNLLRLLLDTIRYVLCSHVCSLFVLLLFALLVAFFGFVVPFSQDIHRPGNLYYTPWTIGALYGVDFCASNLLIPLIAASFIYGFARCRALWYKMVVCAILVISGAGLVGHYFQFWFYRVQLLLGYASMPFTCYISTWYIFKHIAVTDTVPIREFVIIDFILMISFFVFNNMVLSSLGIGNAITVAGVKLELDLRNETSVLLFRLLAVPLLIQLILATLRCIAETSTKLPPDKRHVYWSAVHAISNIYLRLMVFRLNIKEVIISSAGDCVLQVLALWFTMINWRKRLKACFKRVRRRPAPVGGSETDPLLKGDNRNHCTPPRTPGQNDVTPVDDQGRVTIASVAQRNKTMDGTSTNSSASEHALNRGEDTAGPCDRIESTRRCTNQTLTLVVEYGTPQGADHTHDAGHHSSSSTEEKEAVGDDCSESASQRIDAHSSSLIAKRGLLEHVVEGEGGPHMTESGSLPACDGASSEKIEPCDGIGQDEANPSDDQSREQGNDQRMENKIPGSVLFFHSNVIAKSVGITGSVLMFVLMYHHRTVFDVAYSGQPDGTHTPLDVTKLVMCVFIPLGFELLGDVICTVMIAMETKDLVFDVWSKHGAHITACVAVSFLLGFPPIVGGFSALPNVGNCNSTDVCSCVEIYSVWKQYCSNINASYST